MTSSHGGTKTSSLSKEEMDTLRRLMSKLDSFTATVASSSTYNFAQSGTLFTASSSCESTPGIIYSGASDHMTGYSKSYFPPSGKEKVRIADGSLCSVAGKGSLPCTSILDFSSLLHVTNFPPNLLSISSITKHLNCKVTFFPTNSGT